MNTWKGGGARTTFFSRSLLLDLRQQWYMWGVEAGLLVLPNYRTFLTLALSWWFAAVSLPISTFSRQLGGLG